MVWLIVCQTKVSGKIGDMAMKMTVDRKGIAARVPMTPDACFQAAGIFALLGVVLWIVQDE